MTTIRELPAATSIADADAVLIDQAGVTKQAPVALLNSTNATNATLVAAFEAALAAFNESVG